VDVHFLRRFHDARRNAVAADDASKDVHEDGLHTRILQDDAEPGLDRLRARATTDVEKVRRLASCDFDDVHGRHSQTGAVDHAADIAVELYIIQTMLAGLDLQRIFLVDVPQFGYLLLPVL